ncbi:MAG: hypothetical protein J2P45_22180 [Candidatus Dormibacteraeota bacterium]|nr:hypothetical protein [Candidatus Dormibacteraeota bacterium]
MKRETVMLPDDLDLQLRFEAQRRGISIAEVVREALEARFGPRSGAGELSFVAIGKGDGEDISERLDEFVYRAVERHKLPWLGEGAAEPASAQGSQVVVHRVRRPLKGARLHLSQSREGELYLLFADTTTRVASGFASSAEAQAWAKANGAILATRGRVSK